MFTLTKNQASRSPHESQSSKILKALTKAGRFGLWNSELAKIGGLSWHRRVGNLRAEGYNIQSVHIKGSGWKYYLNIEEK